jgi:hypothetical protein
MENSRNGINDVWGIYFTVSVFEINEGYIRITTEFAICARLRENVVA